MLWWTLLRVRSKDPETRRDAMVKILQSTNGRAAKAFVDMLHHEAKPVRASAIVALAVGVFFIRAKSTGTEVLQENAAEVLEDPRTLEAAVASLKDEDWTVRECAAQVLGATMNPSARKFLHAALKDDDERVREAAQKALLQIGESP